MRRRSWLGAATLALLIGVARSRAEACGALPPAYWTLTGTLPAPEQAVPTDGALLITGKAWSDYAVDRSGDELRAGAEIAVYDALGALVSGTFEPWYAGTGPSIAWRPRAPLAPNAGYRVEASVSSGTARPLDATGEPALRATFRTGAGPAPPLLLEGLLTVELETYDLQLSKDCNDCGTGCTPNGSVRALRARITLPPASGGFAPDGYAAWLWLSADKPHGSAGGGLVDSGGLERIVPRQSTVVIRSVPEEDRPYAPCFSLSVSDPAGHTVDAPPLCLPSMDIAATIREIDRRAPADAGAAPDAVVAVPSARGGGCTFAPGSVPPSAAGWLLVVLLVARLPRRSRRG